MARRLRTIVGIVLFITIFTALLTRVQELFSSATNKTRPLTGASIHFIYRCQRTGSHTPSVEHPPTKRLYQNLIIPVNKKTSSYDDVQIRGASRRIRTLSLLIRSQMLYPVKLWMQRSIILYFFILIASKNIPYFNFCFIPLYNSL